MAKFMGIGAVVVGVTLTCGVALGQSTAPTTEPTTMSVTLDAGTPKAAVRSLQTALESGDKQAIQSLLWAQTDAEQRMAQSMAEFSAAVAELRRAAIQTFGAETERLLPLAQPNEIIENAQEVANPDGSVTIAPESGESVVVRQQEGAWRVVILQTIEGTEQSQLDQTLNGISAQVDVYKRMAGEISDGKYRSLEEVATILHEKLMQSAAPTTRPASERVPEELRQAAP